jgi:hypothetical protein
LTAANSALDRSLELDPQSVWANYFKGDCCLRANQPTEAVAAFSACVALSPGSAWCWHNRAVAFEHAGSEDRAVWAIEHAWCMAACAKVMAEGEGVSATSAVIRLFNPLTPFAGYISPNPSELFRLYDVSTGLRDLMADQSDATDIFADLGSGLVFGSATVSAADDGFYVEIALTAEGLDSLSRAVGSWGVGGALDLSREPGPEPEPVPEPTTLLLLGSGLVLGRRLRKRS